MFKVSPAILQTFIYTPNCVLEDRVQYSTVHIPNVFCDGHLQIISCVRIVRMYGFFIAPQRDKKIRCTKTFYHSVQTSPALKVMVLCVGAAAWFGR
jgi:hypothetical protein